MQWGDRYSVTSVLRPPMRRKPPTLPMQRMVRALPILRIDPTLPRLSIEARLPTLESEPALAALAALSKPNALKADDRLGSSGRCAWEPLLPNDATALWQGHPASGLGCRYPDRLHQRGQTARSRAFTRRLRTRASGTAMLWPMISSSSGDCRFGSPLLRWPLINPGQRPIDGLVSLGHHLRRETPARLPPTDGAIHLDRRACTGLTRSSSVSPIKPVTPSVDHLGHGAAPSRHHRCAARQRLGHDEAEGLRPVDRIQQRERVAEELRLVLRRRPRRRTRSRARRATA